MVSGLKNDNNSDLVIPIPEPNNNDDDYELTRKVIKKPKK